MSTKFWTNYSVTENVKNALAESGYEIEVTERDNEFLANCSPEDGLSIAEKFGDAHEILGRVSVQAPEFPSEWEMRGSKNGQ